MAEEMTLASAITAALQKLRTGRFLRAIARRFHELCPAKFDKVPFREVNDNDVFWWKGHCYIKENEDFIFFEKPFPRPFPSDELVEIEHEHEHE